MGNSEFLNPSAEGDTYINLPVRLDEGGPTHLEDTPSLEVVIYNATTWQAYLEANMTTGGWLPANKTDASYPSVSSSYSLIVGDNDEFSESVGENREESTT
jgi:hypothetical protein